MSGTKIDSDISDIKWDRRLRYLHVDEIKVNEHNPREKISKYEVSDIKESIVEMGGILVPLVVIQPDNGQYILLDGERRWRASKELAKEYPNGGYEKVPVNLVRAPLDKATNIEIMFNIHMERKQWSTGAIAEAISELLKITDYSDKELAKKLRVDKKQIRLARDFSKMPEDLKTRALNDELPEYYLIFLSQSLQTVERRYEGLISEYGFNNVAHKMIEKVDNGIVKSADDFRLISKMISTCTNYRQKEIFNPYFKRLVDDDSYTPKEANEDLEIMLGTKVDDIFMKNLRKYKKDLDGYRENMELRKLELPMNAIKLLKEIINIILDIFV